MNFATAACSRAAISLSCREAVLVSLAPWVVFRAAVATPPMFLAISLTPWAASFTLRPISLVVAVCSSTAEAMLLEISLIWLMMVVISSIAVTAPLVTPWMASIFWLISSVALAVCLAKAFAGLSGACRFDGCVQC